jgi:hypothetical protein
MFLHDSDSPQKQNQGQKQGREGREAAPPRVWKLSCMLPSKSKQFSQCNSSMGTVTGGTRSCAASPLAPLLHPASQGPNWQGTLTQAALSGSRTASWFPCLRATRRFHYHLKAVRVGRMQEATPACKVSHKACTLLHFQRPHLPCRDHQASIVHKVAKAWSGLAHPTRLANGISLT